MIKLKDAVEKYGEYEIDESRIEEFLVKPKPKTVWDLKVNDKYYVIFPNGEIYRKIWHNEEFDRNARDLGFTFLTYEEAEFEAERRKVEAELLKLGGTRDMMSFGGKDVYKCFIAYDNCAEKIYISNYYTANHLGQIFFKTEEECQRAIKEIGEDRIKKYIFNVKE